MSVPRGYQSIPLKVNRLQTVISNLTEIFKLIRQTIFTKEIITVPAKKLNSDSENEINTFWQLAVSIKTSMHYLNILKGQRAVYFSMLNLKITHIRGW